VVRLATAAVLGAAAVSKVRAPRAAAAGLATFGIAEPLRVPAALAVAALEAALAAGVAAGSTVAAYAAAALLGVFALLVAVALARGARGAPCGCFGARSRVDGVSVARNAALAGALAAAPSVPSGAPSRDGWLLLGIVAAFACIAALAIALLALAREVGVLRLRLAGESALDVADEGPAIGSRVDLAHRLSPRAATLVALAIFSSDSRRRRRSRPRHA